MAAVITGRIYRKLREQNYFSDCTNVNQPSSLLRQLIALGPSPRAPHYLPIPARTPKPYQQEQRNAAALSLKVKTP